jgi:dipeptidyl aminopeptidase/acylaminoacyl peptidase
LMNTGQAPAKTLADGQRRPLRNDDLWRVRWVDAPRLTPDARHLAYTVTSFDAGVTPGAPSQQDTLLTHVVCDDWRQLGHSPQWSPDGTTLAFISTAPHPNGAHASGAHLNGATGQLWLWHRQSRQAVPLTQLPHECSAPAWSPTGQQIAFLADGQLWRIPVSGETAVALTAPDQAVGPFCWLADGHGLVWCRPYEAKTTAPAQLWLITDDEGYPSPAALIYEQDGPILTLTCAPNGQALAWIGHARGAAQGVNGALFTLALAPKGASAVNLTAALDRSIGLCTRADDARGLAPPDLAWPALTPDRLYVIYAEGGASRLAWVSLDGDLHPVALGAPSPMIPGARSCLSFSVAQNAARLACVIADATHPGEVFSFDLDGGHPRALSAENETWLHEVHLNRPAPLEVTSDDGATVQAWLLLPPPDVGMPPYPLILQIHGGPHYAIGDRFYFEFQRLAAQGYAVLYGNPRGSQGYGETFATQIRGAWGEQDYADLMAMLTVALASPAVDGTRLAVTGVSYGGYMTHVIIGRTTHFRAAISENGISDLTSIFTQSAHQPFWRWEMGTDPTHDPERYRRMSPINAARQIRTPLLLIHAEQDTNVPIRQSEELYAALQHMDCPTALVRIPEEGHLINLIGRLGHRQQRAQAIDQWFARFLR